MNAVDQTDLRLNLLAQEKLTLREGLAWFESLSEPEKRGVLHRLIVMAVQAQVTPQDGVESVRKSGLKATKNSAILVSRVKDHRLSLGKMATLPNQELIDSFQLMIIAFGLADSRRRELKCRTGCSHWWHQLDE